MLFISPQQCGLTSCCCCFEGLRDRVFTSTKSKKKGKRIVVDPQGTEEYSVPLKRILPVSSASKKSHIRHGWIGESKPSTLQLLPFKAFQISCNVKEGRREGNSHQGIRTGLYVSCRAETRLRSVLRGPLLITEEQDVERGERTVLNPSLCHNKLCIKKKLFLPSVDVSLNTLAPETSLI